jgi:hypothetical protein
MSVYIYIFIFIFINSSAYMRHGKQTFLNACYGAERPFPVTHPIYIYSVNKMLKINNDSPARDT